jgi:MFS family permease
LVDRFGRRRTLLVVAVAIMVYGTAFGPLLAADHASHATMLVFLVVGMTLTGLAYGPMSAVLPELFPTNVRYTGSGISFNVSSILGAAVAPFIATWLTTSYGVAWVGLYLIVMTTVSFVALLVIRETKDTSLDSQLPDDVGDAVRPGWVAGLAASSSAAAKSCRGNRTDRPSVVSTRPRRGTHRAAPDRGPSSSGSSCT